MNHLLSLTLAQYAASLKQLTDAVADIPESRMAEMHAGLCNHPAWTLGHCCTAAAFALSLLEEAPPATPINLGDQAFVASCTIGSVPVADRAAYPSKADLLATLAGLHARLAEVVPAKHEAHFGRESPEKFRAFAPTVGNIVFYLLVAHEPYHQGQLSQWKRAAGLGKA